MPAPITMTEIATLEEAAGQVADYAHELRRRDALVTATRQQQTFWMGQSLSDQANRADRLAADLGRAARRARPFVGVRL